MLCSAFLFLVNLFEFEYLSIMQMFLRLHTVIAILGIVSIKNTQQECQMLKKSVTLYRIERILYRYVTCQNLIPTEVFHEVLSTVNSSSEYLEITNSDLPELRKDMFLSLNLTQITIEAGVQIIQDNTFEYLNISTITLDNNKIRVIGEKAFHSFSVHILNIQNNNLTQIGPKIFVGANNLRKLNFQNNQITFIDPDALKDLTSLEEINLSFNNFKTLSSSVLSPLINLQTIYLNNNLFKDLEFNIFLKNKILQYVNLNNNFLTLVDATFFPKSMIYLNLEQNDIESVNISNLINLNHLVLNSNRIKTLTNALNNLPALQSLHLNNNILGTSLLDDTFSQLQNLSILELDNNQISTFNSKILKNTVNLEGLSLAENNITKIDFSGMPKYIKLVNFSQNSLKEIQNLSNLSTLLKLELSYNKLDEIDFLMFEGLYQLQSLWLHHNDIKKLTLGCFRSLKSLVQLDLSYNKITNITSGTLNGLDSINELNLSYNYITSLNQDIFHNMKNLRVLGIAYNNLTNVNIKGILSHTVWLREIDMNGNNWTCRLLINISRDNKLLTLKGGVFYNVSNIYGIPCREVEETEVKFTPDYKDRIPEIVEDVKAIATYAHDMSFKLSFVLTFLIVLLIVMCINFVFLKYSNQVTAAKQFLYQKSESEPEIHLI